MLVVKYTKYKCKHNKYKPNIHYRLTMYNSSKMYNIS